MPTFAELVAQLGTLAILPALAGVGLTLITLVLLDERRLVIGAFAIQSVFVGLLFTRVLAAQLAGIKMLVGLMAALVLYTTAHQCALVDLAAGAQPRSAPRTSASTSTDSRAAGSTPHTCRRAGITS